MINIVFKRRSGFLISYKVLGHADYNIDNEIIYDDLVCGVVSNIAQVIILGVVEVLKLKAPYIAQDGNISLQLDDLHPSEIVAAQVLMDTMLLGLKNLEISYSEYIKVLVEEVQ